MAGRLSSEWLDELRAKVNLEEIVADYVPLKQKGKRFWGCCPFHNEKTPSFSVDSESQLYYCFGCHKGGNVIHFVMEMERMEFLDAVTMLAERAHMPMPDRSAPTPDEDRAAQLREQIYEANRQAAKYYHDLIWTAEGAEALKYLYGRGLNDADIRRFGLGVSGKSWTGLYEALKEAGFSDEVLTRAWLVGEKEGRFHDMFHDRVMFPIINAQGRVLGFGGRIMGDGQPKYMNTSDTPIFNKRLGLYALNFVKKERAIGHLTLVEGYMDTLSLRKYGAQGVVATLGTALTEEQARLIRRYAPEVWISYDGDGAGQKAALRALDIFEPQEIRARVINYPAGMDPDDFIRKNGLAAWEALPKLTPAEYRMLRAKDNLDLTTQDGRTQYAMQCCQIIKGIKSPIEQENYLVRLSHDTGYEKEILARQIGMTAMPRAASASRAGHNRPVSLHKFADYETAERQLVAMLFRGLIPEEMVEPSDVDTPLMRTIIGRLKAGESPQRFIEEISDEDRAAAMAALNFTPLPEKRETALNDAENCINCIRKHRIDLEIDALTAKLGNVTDSAEKKALTERMQDLLQQL